MGAAPSGEQVTLRRGLQRAVVTEVGATLREYRTGDWPVLEGFAEDEQVSGGRGQLLLPWPNRVRDGRYAWEGQVRQLSLTEPPQHNAIHGLARWVNWRVRERDEGRALLSLRLPAQPGWPFLLDLEVEYALEDDGLRVTTSATNVGDGACPYGAGAHPFLAVGTPTIDTALLRLPAATRLLGDERQIPIGAEPVDGTPYDFRVPRPIGDLRLDFAFTDLQRDPDGRARVQLSAPEGGRSVVLWLDEHHSYLMIFSGDTLGPSRARRGLGVEPMTCAPDALNSGDGLRVLAPRERVSTTWGIEPRP